MINLKNFLKCALTIAIMSQLAQGYAESLTPNQEPSVTHPTDHPTDEAMLSSIKTLMAADPILAKAPIKLLAHDGEVSLIGHVSPDQATALTQIAESTHGVNNVDTSRLITHEKPTLINDSLLTAKVKGAYVREKIWSEKDIALQTIHVKTVAAVVYLTGTITTKAQAVNAIKIAKNIAGVKKVVSDLKVKP
jgi:hyperosmotically inducible protein